MAGFLAHDMKKINISKDRTDGNLKKSKLVLPKPTISRSNTELLEAYCNQLMEHFATVTIIATTHDSNRNASALEYYGKGNSFANKAAIQQWLTEDESRTFYGDESDLS